MELTTLLQNNTDFQTLPSTQQQIFFRLASYFEENPATLHMDPLELTHHTQIGNRTHWQNFLTLEPVQAYIKNQIRFNTQVASRKAIAALTREAQQGDTNAARQINDLAGLYEKQDSNKIVVLHRISRPKEMEKEKRV